MGSHAGCTGGSCKVTGDLLAPIDIGRMSSALLVPALPLPRRVDLGFTVGVNQITLADHGCQEYRFLPEVKSIAHDFVDVTASAARSGLYRAEARLNPAAGRSQVSFEAVDPEQAGFFPAIQRAQLFLAFAFDAPLLGLVGRRRFTAFNKLPLRYESEFPLTGFPPLNGPGLVLQEDVRMYDLDRPDEALLMLRAGSRIDPVNRILYDVDATPAEVRADGTFRSHVKVSLNEDVGTVRTGIALLPTRGVALETARLQQVRLGSRPFEFDVVGRITDPDEPHLEVTVRPYSVERSPEKTGFARLDIPLPEKHDHGPNSLHIEHPVRRRVRSGQRERLGITPHFGSNVRSPRYVWVAPHGIALDGATTASPSFTAPVVTKPTDIWFTLYVRDGDRVSAPYKFEYVVEP